MGTATFSTAPGNAVSGYRIFKATSQKFGPYHIKYHPLGGIDAFEEYHVVFENLDKGNTRPKAYYYFDVPMVFVPAKSGKDTALITEAKAIAKVFSGKLAMISAPDLAALQNAAKEEAAKVAENKARQDAINESTTKEDKVQASKASLAAKANEGGKYVPPNRRPPEPTPTAQTANPTPPQTTKPAPIQPAKPTAKPPTQPASKPATQPTVKPWAQPTAKSPAPQGAKPTTPPQGAKPWAQQSAKPTPPPSAKPTTPQGAKPWAQTGAKPTTTQGAKPSTPPTKKPGQ